MADDGDVTLVEVARAGSLFEARLIAGRLESAGIPASISGQSMLEALGAAMTIWTEGVPIEVAADLAEDARRVLEDDHADDSEEE